MARSGMQVFNAEIKIYSGVPITKGRQIAFSTKAKQTAYFESKRVTTIANCKNIKLLGKQGVVRLNLTKAQLAQAQMISFKSPNFDDTIIYAHLIYPYTYVNNQCYAFAFQIDLIQTFMFDMTCNPTTVLEREHMSATDAATAATNPWDPDLWQLRTPEGLAYSRTMEPLNYDFSTEGGRVFDTPYMQDGTETSYLVYLSRIDFDYLDEGALPGFEPSEEFQDLIDWLINPTDGSACWCLVPGTAYYEGLVYNIPNNFFNTQNYIMCFNMSTMGKDKLDWLLGRLTKWGVLSSIVNIYKVPAEMFEFCVVRDLTTVDVIGKDTTISAPTVTLDPKLYNFPFSYLRLISPSGDQKELQYEKFSSMQSGSGSLQLTTVSDVADTPKLIVNPVGYENQGVVYGATYTDLDPMNAMIFDQVPTAPYNIDAFAAAMSAKAQELVRNHTNVQEMDFLLQGYALEARGEQVGYDYASYGAQTALDVASNLTGGGTSVANPKLPGVSDVMGFIHNTDMFEYNSKQVMGANLELAYQKDMVNEAALTLTSDLNTSTLRNYKRTKPAYASAQYIKPNGIGVSHYSAYEFFDILYVHAHLLESVMEQYDAYFRTYGYTSGRVGVPYICNFMKGTGDQPDWRTQPDGTKTTYCKTSPSAFTGRSYDVNSEWENVFDSGTIWIKGDDL